MTCSNLKGSSQYNSEESKLMNYSEKYAFHCEERVPIGVLNAAGRSEYRLNFKRLDRRTSWDKE